MFTHKPLPVEQFIPSLSIDKWRNAWRFGFAKVLTKRELIALHNGLLLEDSAIEQATTTEPSYAACFAGGCANSEPCRGACAIAYAGWRGDGIGSVAEVHEFFMKAKLLADSILALHFPSRTITTADFLNWFDTAPRGEIFTELAGEVCNTLEAMGE